MGTLINLQNLLLEETTSGNGTSDVGTFIMIIFMIILIVFIAIMAPLTSIKPFDFNPEYFKKIKIKKRYSKLFMGYSGGAKRSIYGDVTKYGIMIPFFILHLTGYILALLSTIAVIIMFCLKVNVATIGFTIVCVFVFQMTALLITNVICFIITKKKDKEQNKKGKNHED